MDWEFPSDEMRSDYIKLGKYVPADIAPLGINVWNDKVFITVPRWRKGVPANLNYISLSEAAAARQYYFVYSIIPLNRIGMFI